MFLSYCWSFPRSAAVTTPAESDVTGMADGTMNDDATASVAFTSLQPFIVPVLVLFATVAWWKRRAPVASKQLVRTELGWRDLPDELIARIATLVPLPMQNLPRLALVERRCRQPSAAQLS